MKAAFHKSQRVYVKPVGTWALIEKVVPHWVKDIDEPLRITYDCGLGREFQAGELVSELAMNQRDRMDDEMDLTLEQWRIKRTHNRAGNINENHPYPGTFPSIITDEQEWGGWRVPGAEYDRDPERVEHQARMIVNAPDLIRMARKISEIVTDNPEKMPKELLPIAKNCASILQFVYDIKNEQEELAQAS